MACSFLPTIITDSVTDLTPELLRQRGIRLLMLDFDNTIVPYTTNVPTEKMERWLKEMVASDIPVCVVSNSKKDRVKIFCHKYGMACITHARKPFPRGIRECLRFKTGRMRPCRRSDFHRCAGGQMLRSDRCFGHRHQQS